MNELEQFTDNSLLACMALEVMANYAIDNKVPLSCDYKDAGRRSAAANNKSFGEVETCFNVIKPYIEDNNLRAPIGLWREHIALADICQFKLDKANSDLKNLWAGEDDSVVDQHKSNVRRYERKLKLINDQVALSEHVLEKKFNSESEFKDFKINYDILYQNYMHRSHSPFNSTPFMGKEDADDNFWLWNKTISDERPHRDIFYNQFKDFDKINNRMKKRVGGRKGNSNNPVEFHPLESELWNDKTLD